MRGGYPQLAVVSSRRRFGRRLSILRVLGGEDLRELLSSLGV
ncbi:MAG: hypothetical protein QXM53_07290 [Thermofilaceae archaeon]